MKHILSESPRPNFFRQNPVGSGDDAHIDFSGLTGPQAGHFMLLEYAQQSNL